MESFSLQLSLIVKSRKNCILAFYQWDFSIKNFSNESLPSNPALFCAQELLLPFSLLRRDLSSFCHATRQSISCWSGSSLSLNEWLVLVLRSSFKLLFPLFNFHRGLLATVSERESPFTRRNSTNPEVFVATKIKSFTAQIDRAPPKNEPWLNFCTQLSVRTINFHDSHNLLKVNFGFNSLCSSCGNCSKAPWAAGTLRKSF